MFYEFSGLLDLEWMQLFLWHRRWYFFLHFSLTKRRNINFIISFARNKTKQIKMHITYSIFYNVIVNFFFFPPGYRLLCKVLTFHGYGCVAAVDLELYGVLESIVIELMK